MNLSDPEPALTPRFAAALNLAADLHARQLRKGTRVPYISHPLGVASIALEHGANEDEAIAALLHDAVEDQGGMETAELIKNSFGGLVADIVLACSNTTGDDPRPSAVRKAAHVERLRHEDDASVLLVSAADKLHNARTILQELKWDPPADRLDVWSRFSDEPAGVLAYYRSLVDALRDRDRRVAPLANELAFVVEEIAARAPTAR